MNKYRLIALTVLLAATLFGQNVEFTPPEVETGDWKYFPATTYSLIHHKRYEEAFQRIWWYHNNAVKYGISDGRLDVFIWLKVAIYYPPAMEALLKVRDEKIAYLKSDAARAEIPAYMPNGERRDWKLNPPTEKEQPEYWKSTLADASLFQEVTAINEHLYCTSETFQLLLFLDKYNPELAAKCWQNTKDTFLKYRPYDDMARKYDTKLEEDYAEYLKKFPETLESIRTGGTDFIYFRNLAFQKMQEFMMRAQIQDKLELREKIYRDLAGKLDELKPPPVTPPVKQPDMMSEVQEKLKELRKNRIKHKNYAETLQQYQALCDYNKILADRGNVFLSRYIFKEWYQLGLVHQPAMEALISERDYMENYIRSYRGETGPDTSRDWTAKPPATRQEAEKRYGYRQVAQSYFQQIMYIDKLLEKEKSTLELFRYLDKYRPGEAMICAYSFIDTLVEEKEADLLRRYSGRLEESMITFLKTYDPTDTTYRKEYQEQQIERYTKQARLIGQSKLADDFEKEIAKKQEAAKKQDQKD